MSDESEKKKEINMIMSVAEHLLIAIAPKVIEPFVESMCYISTSKSGGRWLTRQLKTTEEIPSVDEIYTTFIKTSGVEMSGLRPVVQQKLREITQRHYDYIIGTTR